MTAESRRLRQILESSDRKQRDPFEARTIVEERRYRKQRLAAGYRIFAHFGFDEGAAGYITAADPERSDLMWAAPFPMSFKSVRARDLLLVDSSGQVVDFDGNEIDTGWPVSASAVQVHFSLLEARPEMVCMAHAHTMYGKAFASLGQPLAPLTQDACIFYEDHGSEGGSGGGVSNHDAEGDRVTAAVGQTKAAIIADHGILTIGQSIEEAVFWFVSLEHSCQAELLARAAGEPNEITHETASLIHSQVGSAIAGWYSAQPMFDWIMESQPDCLDEG